MIPRAAEIYAQLEGQRRQFLSRVHGLTADQRSFRPHPDAWCSLEVGHHVVLAEQGITDALAQHRGTPSGTRGLRFRIGNALLWLVLKTGLRVKNPAPEAAPRKDVSLAELDELWKKARSDLEAFLEELEADGLRDAGFRHPVGGPYNVEEALEFLGKHLAHHLRQLDRIEQHGDFPPS